MCWCTPSLRTPFCGKANCARPAPGMTAADWERNGPDHADRTGNALHPLGMSVYLSPADRERDAFIVAITKLADDAGFRRSFMEHYQLWLHPPMLVPRDVHPGSDVFTVGPVFFGGCNPPPAAQNFRTFMGGNMTGRIFDDVDPAARAQVKTWCPDRNDQPIEGIEIAPRPVLRTFDSRFDNSVLAHECSGAHQRAH